MVNAVMNDIVLFTGNGLLGKLLCDPVTGATMNVLGQLRETGVIVDRCRVWLSEGDPVGNGFGARFNPGLRVNILEVSGERYGKSLCEKGETDLVHMIEDEVNSQLREIGWLN